MARPHFRGSTLQMESEGYCSVKKQKQKPHKQIKRAADELGPHPWEQTLNVLPPGRDFPFPLLLSLSSKACLEALQRESINNVTGGARLKGSVGLASCPSLAKRKCINKLARECSAFCGPALGCWLI